MAARSLGFPADSPNLIAVAAADVNTLTQENFGSERPVLSKPDLISTHRVSTEAFGPAGPPDIVVADGTTIQFETTATDDDSHPLWHFHSSPPVTFTLEPGEPSRTFDLSVTVYDSLGISTTVPIQAKAS